MRNTKAIVFIPLFGLTTLTAQANIEQSFDVERFTRVAASQGIEVNIVQGDAAQVVASAATEKDLERLEIEVENGELRMRRSSWAFSFWNWGESYGNVKVDIVMPELSGLSSSSGAHVTALDIKCDKLAIDASSGSTLALSGNCDHIDVDASSGASIDARDLESDVVVVDASSGANIDVFALTNFQGDASSGANVEVHGGAQVFDSDTSSGARIARRGAGELI